MRKISVFSKIKTVNNYFEEERDNFDRLASKAVSLMTKNETSSKII